MFVAEENRYYLCPGCKAIWTRNDLFDSEGACLNYGSGEPDECTWEDELDEITNEPIVVMSPAGFLYGTISSITWGIMIILTTHRRRWYTIIRKHKLHRQLGDWERVDPPRKMLAIDGRVVNIKPPRDGQ